MNSVDDRKQANPYWNKQTNIINPSPPSKNLKKENEDIKNQEKKHDPSDQTAPLDHWAPLIASAVW